MGKHSLEVRASIDLFTRLSALPFAERQILKKADWHMERTQLDPDARFAMVAHAGNNSPLKVQSLAALVLLPSPDKELGQSVVNVVDAWQAGSTRRDLFATSMPVERTENTENQASRSQLRAHLLPDHAPYALEGDGWKVEIALRQGSLAMRQRGASDRPTQLITPTRDATEVRGYQNIPYPLWAPETQVVFGEVEVARLSQLALLNS